MQGASRFLKRIWKAVHAHAAGGAADAISPTGLDETQKVLRRQVHQTLAKVSDDIGRRRTFNTAIAAVMELLNAITRVEARTPSDRAVLQEALDLTVLMLSPIVPHICHRLWNVLGHAGAIIDQPWPQPDTSALVAETLEIVVQVNGKVRGRVSVAATATEADVQAAALADHNVQRFVGGQTVKKVIVVPGRLVNVVV
jgi:leucyl-tRNA synthetase